MCLCIRPQLEEEAMIACLASVCVYIYVCVYVYVYVCICIYTFIYVYIYMCVYVRALLEVASMTAYLACVCVC